MEFSAPPQAWTFIWLIFFIWNLKATSCVIVQVWLLVSRLKPFISISVILEFDTVGGKSFHFWTWTLTIIDAVKKNNLPSISGRTHRQPPVFLSSECSTVQSSTVTPGRLGRKPLLFHLTHQPPSPALRGGARVLRNVASAFVCQTSVCFGTGDDMNLSRAHTHAPWPVHLRLLKGPLNYQGNVICFSGSGEKGEDRRGEKKGKCSIGIVGQKWIGDLDLEGLGYWQVCRMLQPSNYLNVLLALSTWIR